MKWKHTYLNVYRLGADSTLLLRAGFLKKLVLIGIEKMLDLMRPKEQEMLATLLVRLAKEGSVPKEDLMAALQKNSDQLEDLRS